jgi:hypothetical protein
MSKQTVCVSLAVAGLALWSVVSLDATVKPATRHGSGTRLVPAQSVGTGEARAGVAAGVIDQYCIGCHSERTQAGSLVLEGLDPEAVGPAIDTWEKVVRKLRGGVMPPVGRPRPDGATYRRLIAGLENALDRHADTTPNAGRPAVHRLNRSEYANAVRDLLALDVDGAALLPADNSGYGFDNVADVLTLSPGLLERYLLAAKKIARLAVGDPSIRPTTATYDIPYMTLMQDTRMSEALPFGSRGGVAIRHYFPTDGAYEIKVRLQRNSLNIGNEIRGLEVMNQIDIRLDGVRLERFEMGGRTYGRGTYTETEDIEDERLRLRFQAKAGMRTVGVTLNRDHWYVEGVGMERLPPASDGYASGRQTERDYGRIDMGVDRVDITGPYEAQLPEESLSRQHIFVCRATGDAAADASCARTILTTVARRAYRRPLTEDDSSILLEFYQQGRDAGGSFDDGIERGLIRLLTDPDFLIRIERDPATVEPSTPYRVGDLELASRLSFFLWSSIPDDELLDVAVAGRLRDAAVFERQVRRMLADERAEAMIDNFFGQWLLLRNMATVRPDPKTFPDFDENLREAFTRETDLFLRSQIRDDRPITELLTADYTYVNERLARHYGFPNVYGSHFRRQPLPPGQRAGVLGHGSLLTVTSYADRTSVVVRGKFILENILGTPAPAPPANVPPLENTEVRGSLRQRMEQHRRNPVCASCHAQIDPMGFALENFDGIGKWRDEDGHVPVDASGVLPDGTPFDDTSTFRDALMQHDAAFISTLTEKLLTYALGRGLEAYDMPALRSIIRETKADGNRWSVFIINLTKSLPFQMRMSES